MKADPSLMQLGQTSSQSHRPASQDLSRPGASPKRGFTLLEVMVALTITLILMGLVVEIFSRIGKGVNNSRANMELNDQLRNAKHRLIQDLRGATAPMTPPLDPFMNLGYFEYVEGPRVASSQIWSVTGSTGGDYGIDLGIVTGSTRAVNSVIGDTDDILMFTTSSFDGEMFVGKGGLRTTNNMTYAIQSRYAEVAWFLRRTQFATSIRAASTAVTATSDNHAEFFNLHRRSWLVLPEGNPFGGRTYADADISMSPVGGNYGATEMPPNAYISSSVRRVTPTANFNSLGDLTKRELRSVHQPYKWPYEMMYVISSPSWGSGTNYVWNTAVREWDRFPYLSLPTLAEQSSGTFPMPFEKVSGVGAGQTFVTKSNIVPGLGATDLAFPNAITTTGQHASLPEGLRIGEDVILTNVVSFDVKAWDPGAPVFASPIVDSTSTPIAGVLVPGDAAYIQAVDKFIGAPGTADAQPVGFGAYADLNYMATDVVYPNCIDRWTKYGGGGGSTGAIQTMAAGAPYLSKSKMPLPAFAHPGEGPLAGYPITATGATFTSYPCPRPCVYDTWSTHYEFDGMDNDADGQIDEKTNGVDDNGNGLIDEPNAYNNGAIQSGEQDGPPPYRSPLRGIKITIRVMEVESKQVREVTVVQEFIPL